MKISTDAAQLLATFTAAHFRLDDFDDVTLRSGAWEEVAKVSRELNGAAIIDHRNFSRHFGADFPDGRLYVLDLSPEISPDSSTTQFEAICIPRTWSALSGLQDRLIDLDGFMVDLIVFDDALAHALVRRLETFYLFRLRAIGLDTDGESRD